MREPNLRYVQGFTDGRGRSCYFERCACGASLVLTIVDRVSSAAVVLEAFGRWRSEHKGEGCGESPLV